MIVIYDTLGAFGGSHTLMLRMGEWANANNVKMTIIGTSISNTNIIEELKAVNVNIICADLADSKRGYRILDRLISVEPIKVYCFAWNHYLDIERIKKKYQLAFDDFIYCIHPDTFKKGIGFKSRVMRKYSIRSYVKIFKRMCINNAIISLDEVNIEESEEYLGYTMLKKPPIVRLPMYCPKREDVESIVTTGYRSNVLLTAARADFPYKGYMIGLIDIFVGLKGKFPKLKLEIVTSGDDIEQLVDKIMAQSEEVRSAIVVHGWMEYEDLKKEMRNCKVFIGMGTTVFDSSLQYKPSIAVRFNTMECIGDCLVAERPTYMTAPANCKESAEKTIERVLMWDFEEYKNQSIKAFERVKDVYDIEKCMEQLLRIENKNKDSLLSIYECSRHFLNRMFNSIRYRNRNASDYRNIKWDKEP